MPTRRRSNRRQWHQIGCFLVGSLVISAAQQSVRREVDNEIINEKQQQQQREEKRKTMLKVRQDIIYSTGSIDWNGIEENGIELPLFGVPHRSNRRKLKSSKLSNAFTPEELELYSIGTGRFTKKSKKKSSNKGGGKGAPKPKSGSAPRPKSGSAPRPTPRPPYPPNGQPSHRPPRPPNNGPPSPRPPSGGQPSPSPPGIGGCKAEINVDFLQLSAIPPALFVNPNDPNEQTLGTRYVYNDGLRDQDTLDELIDSNVSGTCTRIQSRVGNQTIGLQLGRGQCQFTYKLKDSKNRELVFTASGDVSDSLGGILSITGGSLTAMGAYGEVELLPVNLLPDGEFEIENGDFFLDPLFYVADARIIVPCD